MTKLADRRNHKFTQENLSAYLDGELSERDAARVRAHLASCETCRQEMEALQLAIRTLSGLPRVSLPCSFTLSPEAVQAQRRVRRLDMAYAALRTAAVALSLALVLLLSGERLLASGVISLPIGGMASESADALPMEAAVLQAEAEMQHQATEAEAGAPVMRMVLPEDAAGAEPAQEEAIMARQLPEPPPAEEGDQVAEVAMALPEEVRPSPAATGAMTREKQATRELPPTAQPQETAPSASPTPSAEPTLPPQGVAAVSTSVTASVGVAAAPTAVGDGGVATRQATLPEAAPERTPRAGAGASALAPTATPAPWASPTLSQTLAPSPTTTPLPTVAPSPTPTRQELVAPLPPTAEAPLAAEALEAAQSPAPEEGTAPAEAPALEDMAVAFALEAPPTPSEAEGAIAQVASAPQSEPETEAAQALAASAPPSTTAMGRVLATLRQAVIVLAGVTLIVLGGLLWLGHKRRL